VSSLSSCLALAATHATTFEAGCRQAASTVQGCDPARGCDSSPGASARDQPCSLRSSLEPGEITVKDAACGQPRFIRRFDQHRPTSTWSQQAHHRSSKLG
jgi:hypothetical protein